MSTEIAQEDLELRSRQRWRKLLLLLNLGVVALLTLYFVVWYNVSGEAAPTNQYVADFELTDQNGRTVRRQDLLRHVWVANFIFTHCTAACPGMTTRMAAIQARVEKDPVLKKSVRLVSFSVDPERDTPEQLRSFANSHQADDEAWWFLTGEKGVVAELSQKGFLLPAGRNLRAEEEFEPPVLHSDRFVLVRVGGKIHGHYDLLGNAADMKRLLDDLHALVKDLEASSTR